MKNEHAGALTLLVSIITLFAFAQFFAAAEEVQIASSDPDPNMVAFAKSTGFEYAEPEPGNPSFQQILAATGWFTIASGFIVGLIGLSKGKEFSRWTIMGLVLAIVFWPGDFHYTLGVGIVSLLRIPLALYVYYALNGPIFDAMHAPIRRRSRRAVRS